MATIGKYSLTILLPHERRNDTGPAGRRRPEARFALHRRNSAPIGPFTRMIAITITPAAFEAIAPTLQFGSIGFEFGAGRERQAPSTSTISTSAAPSRSARAA